MQRRVAEFWKREGHAGRAANPQDGFAGRELSEYLDKKRLSQVIHLRSGLESDFYSDAEMMRKELIFDAISCLIEVPRGKGRAGEAWKRQAAADIERQCVEAAKYVADVLCNSLGILVKAGVVRIADIEQKIGAAANLDFCD